MSQENVEIVRRGLESFNRGDLDGMLADVAPDCEYVTTGSVPGVEGVYRAPEGVRRFITQFADEFDEMRIELHELVDAGDQVLVSMTLRGRGSQSGVDADWHVWQLWTVRERRVLRGQGFTSREAALEAAGLSE